MEKLRVQLGLTKLKPTPYNLHMADQTIAKPLGLIKDLKILVHGISLVVTFTIIHSSVLDFSYSMLLGHAWLHDIKVFHDWVIILSLYKEPIQSEPYMLLKSLEHTNQVIRSVSLL
jgi:hypothetical protein